METPEEHAKGEKLPFYKRKEFLPLAVFAGFLLILLLSTSLSGHPPVIDRVTQENNLSQEIVTIEGGSFGPETGGEVRIGDLTLTPSNYLKWGEEKIVVAVPHEVSSGIISVVTKNGSCRGDIYMNPDEIPRLAGYSGPLIKSLSPENTSPGRTLVIKGERFGKERGSSLVAFPLAVPLQSKQGSKEQSVALVSAEEEEYEYVLWSDNEIRVRVPDGAKSGQIVVSTEKGLSNSKYITIISPVGRKQYQAKAGYTLRSSVGISDITASLPNKLYLWIPQPVASPEQRNAERIKISPAPQASRLKGILIFKLEDLKDGEQEGVSIETTLDRYEVATEIDPSLVNADYEREGVFYQAWTADDRFVKPSHPAIAGLLWRIVGNEKNPYLKAKRIYDYILSEFSYEDALRDESSEWYAVIAEKRLDDGGYANLFTAFARSAGIPARLVAGYLVDEARKTYRHYWSEFYLTDFGWVSVDPLLGQGRNFGSFKSVPNPAEYYFGNLDNRHITLAKGCLELHKMTPQGRITFSRRTPGLQSFYEEAVGNLSKYEATWDDLTVAEIR